MSLLSFLFSRLIYNSFPNSNCYVLFDYTLSILDPIFDIGAEEEVGCSDPRLDEVVPVEPSWLTRYADVLQNQPVVCLEPIPDLIDKFRSAFRLNAASATVGE